MAESDRFIRDTRFGAWLVGSDLWMHLVVRVALAQLIRLLGRPRRRYDRILDVGCGGGGALPLLDRYFTPDTLVGVDPDPGMLARAAERVARCRGRVELKVGRATRLALPDDSGDMVFCHQTLHHVADPDGAARELYRVLKPGGVLLFSESCAPFIRSWLIRVLFRHPMQAQRLADEYLALLIETGFTFTRENVATPYPWWSRPDVGLLEWLGRPVPAGHAQTLVNVAAFKSP
jgi:ubiquinone/menaquinone biosynthesis C-methylase UbiE